MKKNISKILLSLILFLSTSVSGRLIEVAREPYERPIGFNLNFGGLFSLTYEAKVFVGLTENISAVAAPTYQNTIEVPIFDYRDSQSLTFFGFKRFNLGLGFRHHFFDYDSRDGWFMEYMVRNGVTWMGEDEHAKYALTPSIMLGYSKVYDSGYFVSFGGGISYEVLFGKEVGYHEYLMKNNYFITQIPFVTEIGLGWMWW